MNRLGFLLLAVGVILAGLGWFYDQPAYTGIGLIPLVVLYLLAAFLPDVIDYTHSRHAESMPPVMNWAWRGAAYVGVAMFVAATWHSTASGGTGLPLAVAAAALPISIVGYGIVNDDRVRQWRQSRGLKRRGRQNPASV
jgi:hypothetical protein